MSDFDLVAPPPRTVSKRTEADRRKALARQEKMHLKYGPGPKDQTCGACVNFVHFNHGGWAKCSVYGVTSSEASDWRAKWPTCGMFQPRGV